MPDWQININKETPVFNPQTRRAVLGDNLYWTNNTDEPHLPWPLDSNGQPTANGWGLKEIPPQQSSDSLPVPTPNPSTYNPMQYYCRIHEHRDKERGFIQVLDEPPTL